MSLASAKSNVRLVKNEEGKWCYPATQRSDGTWRKPIPVRDTYIPQEIQEKYVCRGRREADAAEAEKVRRINLEDLEEDTTDFIMDRSKRAGNGKETCSVVKKTGCSIPKMDNYWKHLVPPDPTESSEHEPPQAPPPSVDDFDGPRNMDKTSSDNSWNSSPASSSQGVASVPVVDFEEKCLSWKNEENEVCDKMVNLNVSENKATATLDERSLADLLEQEKKSDIEDFKTLVSANLLSPMDYVNSWNYLVTKWIEIQKMTGVASNADIAKLAKSYKLMM